MKLVINGANNPAKPKLNSIKLLAFISSFFLTIAGIKASKDDENKDHNTKIIDISTTCSILIVMNWKKTDKKSTGSPIQSEITIIILFFSYTSDRIPPTNTKARETTLIDPRIKPSLLGELVRSKMTHPWTSDIESKAKWKKKIEENT